MSDDARNPNELERLGRLRASDAERDAVLGQLSEHAALGRLTLAELEERAGQALAAKTHAELAALTNDLPTTAVGQAPRRRQATRWLVGVFGGTDKSGRWRISGQTTAVAVFGGHDIDLRSAELDGNQARIVVVSVFGGSDIYVPDSVDLVVDGFSIFGGDSQRGSERPPRADAPQIHISSYNFMGGNDIWLIPADAQHLPLKQARKLAKQIQSRGPRALG